MAISKMQGGTSTYLNVSLNSRLFVESLIANIHEDREILFSGTE